MNKEQKKTVLERIHEGTEVGTAVQEFEVHGGSGMEEDRITYYLAANMADFLHREIVGGRVTVERTTLPPIEPYSGQRHRMELTVITRELLSDIVQELERRPLSARLREEHHE